MNGQNRHDIKSVKSTLTLFALIAGISEAGLGTIVWIAAEKDNLVLSYLAAVGMIALLGLIIYIAGKNWEVTKDATAQQLEDARRQISELEAQRQSDLKPSLENLELISGPSHLPLEQLHARAFEREWRAEWFARNKEGKMVPYVRDTVTIDQVDPETGEVRGSGLAQYAKAKEDYEIRGRLSRQGLAQLYYKCAPPHEEKFGIVILRFDFQREFAVGWWLGGGRGPDKPPVGGRVQFQRPQRYKEGEWENKVFPFDNDPSWGLV